MSILRVFHAKLCGKHLHFVYFSFYTSVCTSDCATLLFPPPRFLTLHGLNSGVTRSALFIIVYLERTCFIRQAVLPCPIDCKASVERGDGKGEGERRRETLLYLLLYHEMYQAPVLTCCIDMKNIDFSWNESPEYIF